MDAGSSYDVELALTEWPTTLIGKRRLSSFFKSYSGIPKKLGALVQKLLSLRCVRACGAS